jgi:very-short-patch-repair endonuclease/predicted transcriptional regulator of viral defense system
MRTENAKVRVGAIAARQSGRIARWQLEQLRVDSAVIARWVRDGYLHRKLPGVYAVGHDAPSVVADLAAALLYAGPGAMLSHGTAAWWWGLIDNQPSTINVSTPRRCRSRRGIKVHQRRDCERAWHKRLPVTTVEQALLDYAAKASLNKVRLALASTEYRRLLNVEEVQRLLGPGRRGGATLRKALVRHQPRLARARSPVEVAFFELCERFDFSLPEVNVPVAGWTADFFWRDAGLVVELDPYGNHHTPAQVDRDRRKDLALRTAGLVVHRYSRDQLDQTPDAIAADVTATLAQRRALSARSPAGS